MRDKYVNRLYATSGQDDPLTNLRNGKPPIKQNSPTKESPKVEPAKKTLKVEEKSNFSKKKEPMDLLG